MWRPLTALLQLAVASDGSLTANRMEPVVRQAAAPMASPSLLCPPLPPAAPSRLAREVCELEPTQQWSTQLVKRAAPVEGIDFMGAIS
jgi:hypothetical protein